MKWQPEDHEHWLTEAHRASASTKVLIGVLRPVVGAAESAIQKNDLAFHGTRPQSALLWQVHQGVLVFAVHSFLR